MKLSKLALAGMLAAASVAGSMTAAAPASAASYGGECGAGYAVVNSAAVGGDATMFLTYNNGWNCLVVVRNTQGSATFMGAYLKKSSVESFTKDEGYFTRYAGPVYVLATDSCVDWRGRVDSTVASKYGTNCG
ncbi:spore-associated protein A [Streptosporangium sp. CA-135522]|uniref:spore-associated protein A n=1 Tax=Streptosporangium sp. CA-135522 TaxID=3240072 RepID=UPI003D8CC6C0